MIILLCGYCKNKDLEIGRFFGETKCPYCNRLLNLWETRMVQISTIQNAEVAPEGISENCVKVTDLNLTQSALK